MSTKKKKRRKKSRKGLSSKELRQLAILGIIVLVVIVAVAAVFILTGGTQLFQKNAKIEPPAAIETNPTQETSETVPETTVDPMWLKGDAAVEHALESMSLEQKIYQLFIVTPEVLVDNVVSCVVQTGPTTKEALSEKPVGGVIFFAQNLENADQTTDMITGMQSCMRANEYQGLWIAVDEEGGSVTRVAKQLDTTKYDTMESYGKAGDAEAVRKVGEGIAKDISKFGFNLDFAPVADVNINSQNELGDRIFSSDPQTVSTMVGAMVEGLQSSGEVSATLKHFPGLGAESGNTHEDKQTHIDRSLDQLRNTEFVAFQGGLDAGADFVLVGHQIVSAAGDGLPSSMSPVVINDWLRGELGFQGVVITDSHQMNTIAGTYGSGEAAVKTLQAGGDIILMPADLGDAYQGVYEAVQNGTLTEERIDESVRRILTAKEKHGLLY